LTELIELQSNDHIGIVITYEFTINKKFENSIHSWKHEKNLWKNNGGRNSISKPPR